MSLCYDFQKWTMISLASVGISPTIGLVLMQYAHGYPLYHHVSAQPVEFKTYTNDDMKFSIKHPSDWKVEEYSNSTEFTIREWVEETGGYKMDMRTYFSVDVKGPDPYLNTDTLTIQNRTLEHYVQIQKDGMPNYETLLRENNVTVGEYNGWKMKSTFNSDQKGGYGFDILTVIVGKLYTLSYIETALKVPETLPLANKMVESFQVGIK